MSRLLSCLLAAALPLVAQGPSLEPVRQSELAFAQLAAERGIRAAFRTWLTDDARVFTPGMTTAKVAYAPDPGDTGHLAWYPEAMGIAASGDLAWSLGPWTYAPSRGAPVRVHGHFLSLWRKQATGDWRVVADIGVPHPMPGVPGQAFLGGNTLGSQPGQPEDRAHRETELRRLEATLSEAWVSKGGLALEPRLARGARVLRRGRLPLQEAAVIHQALAGDPTGGGWGPSLVDLSAAGDLAWSCGETRPGPKGESASFLRIWIRESGTWKVLFDVRLPHPSPIP